MSKLGEIKSTSEIDKTPVEIISSNQNIETLLSSGTNHETLLRMSFRTMVSLQCVCYTQINES